jgi:hypothetical protein
MRKNVVQILLSVGLPLTFAVGCSNTRQQEAAVYSPAAGAALTPTGEITGTARSNDAAVPEGIITRTTAPSGASAEDWALGEELRGTLTSEKSLVPYPSEVCLVVDKDSKGLVRLLGVIRNDYDRQQLRDRIAKVPGVVRIDDQITVGFAQHPDRLDPQRPISEE